MLQWVAFALILGSKMFLIAGNNMNVIRSQSKVPDIFVGFYPNLEFFSAHCHAQVANTKFPRTSIQWEPGWRIGTGGRTGMTKLMGAFRNVSERA
jgi:hypothetical protein